MYHLVLSLALLGQAPNPVFDTGINPVFGEGVAQATPPFNRFDKLATIALEHKAAEVAKRNASLTNQDRRRAIDTELRALTIKLGVPAPFMDGESAQIANVVDNAASPYDHNPVVAAEAAPTPPPVASGSREVGYHDAVIGNRTYKVWGTLKSGHVTFDLSKQSPEVKAAYAPPPPPAQFIPQQRFQQFAPLPLFQGSACGPNGCPR
jgi:hypothetical protein